MGCTFSYSEDPRFTITSPLFFLFLEGKATIYVAIC